MTWCSISCNFFNRKNMLGDGSSHHKICVIFLNTKFWCMSVEQHYINILQFFIVNYSLKSTWNWNSKNIILSIIIISFIFIHFIMLNDHEWCWFLSLSLHKSFCSKALWAEPRFYTLHLFHTNKTLKSFEELYGHITIFTVINFGIFSC